MLDVRPMRQLADLGHVHDVLYARTTVHMGMGLCNIPYIHDNP
jgi:hypothetical protein